MRRIITHKSILLLVIIVLSLSLINIAYSKTKGGEVSDKTPSTSSNDPKPHSLRYSCDQLDFNCDGIVNVADAYVNTNIFSDLFNFEYTLTDEKIAEFDCDKLRTYLSNEKDLPLNTVLSINEKIVSCIDGKVTCNWPPNPDAVEIRVTANHGEIHPNSGNKLLCWLGRWRAADLRPEWEYYLYDNKNVPGVEYPNRALWGIYVPLRGENFPADYFAPWMIVDGIWMREEKETCSDGILNQDETAVDCGGSCEACQLRCVSSSDCPSGFCNTNGYCESACTSCDQCGAGLISTCTEQVCQEECSDCYYTPGGFLNIGNSCDPCTDLDSDGYSLEEGCGQVDCDDSDSSVNPGATEVCNGVDNNCDGHDDIIEEEHMRNVCEPGEPTTEFTFAVYSDSQGGDEAHRRIVNKIMGIDPDFTVMVGDLVDDAGDLQEWQDFLNIIEPICKSRDGSIDCKESTNYLDTNYFPVVGNHDIYGDKTLQNFRNFFSFLNNDRWYSFDYENSHFIILDTNTNYEPDSPQYEWLVDDLISNEQDFVFVFFHHLAYGSQVQGGHDPEEGIQEHLVPLFEQYGVDVVFNGHNHIYERMCPLLDNKCNEEGINYFVLGSAGGGLRPVPVEPEYYSEYQESTYNYLKVEVLNNEIKIKSYRDDGSLIEEITRTSYQQSLCNDNVQNGDETDVDCGGSCVPCSASTQGPFCEQLIVRIRDNFGSSCNTGNLDPVADLDGNCFINLDDYRIAFEMDEDLCRARLSLDPNCYIIFEELREGYSSQCGDSNFNSIADLNNDCTLDIYDLTLLTQWSGEECEQNLAYNCESGSIIGDINADGEITNSDLIILRRVVEGIWNEPPNICCYDINDDNLIDNDDVEELRLYIADLGSEGTLIGQRCISQETCNGIDDDNDGFIDIVEADNIRNVCPEIAYYCNQDGDNFVSKQIGGTCNTYNCIPNGCRTNQGYDCDDNNADVYPRANEICDRAGIDHDCDGKRNEGCEGVCDTDNDGHSESGAWFFWCSQPRDDCDDSRSDVYPGAEEICDGVDNNCDGQDDIIKEEDMGNVCEQISETECGDKFCDNSEDFNSCAEDCANSNLVAYWNFDSPNPSKDKSGNRNDLILSPRSSLNGGLIGNGHAYSSRPDRYTETTRASTKDSLTNVNELTYSLWFKANVEGWEETRQSYARDWDLPNIEIVADLIEFSATRNNRANAILSISNHPGQSYVRFQIRINKEGINNWGFAGEDIYISETIKSPINDFLDNQWHHLVVSVKGKEIKINFDGETIDIFKQTVTSNRQEELIPIGELDAPIRRINIPGKDIVLGYMGVYGAFKGQMDEIRIYNKALSSSEIRNIYNKESGNAPVTEICNGLDDDGDGAVDEDSNMCKNDDECINGNCVVVSEDCQNAQGKIFVFERADGTKVAYPKSTTWVGTSSVSNSGSIVKISLCSRYLNLKDLHFDSTKVSDISPVQDLVNLEDLSFSATQVTDLSGLGSLPNLKQIEFDRTQISDLTPLQNLKNIRFIEMEYTPVTSLRPLENLELLSRIRADGSSLSCAEINRFKRAIAPRVVTISGKTC